MLCDLIQVSDLLALKQTQIVLRWTFLQWLKLAGDLTPSIDKELVMKNNIGCILMALYFTHEYVMVLVIF